MYSFEKIDSLTASKIHILINTLFLGIAIGPVSQLPKIMKSLYKKFQMTEKTPKITKCLKSKIRGLRAFNRLYLRVGGFPKILVTTHPLDILEGKVTAHSLDEIRGIKPSATGSVLLVRCREPTVQMTK